VAVPSQMKGQLTGLSFRIALGERHQHTDSRHPVGLLRARYRRATESHDELAPPHASLPKGG
jgi:hypothetical protein